MPLIDEYDFFMQTVNPYINLHALAVLTDTVYGTATSVFLCKVTDL